MPFVMILMPADNATPRLLPPDVRAVGAEPYLAIEEAHGNPGGLTRAELRDDDIRALGSFDDGDQLYIEGEPEQVLDDTDDDTIAATRVWWRAVLVER